MSKPKLTEEQITQIKGGIDEQIKEVLKAAVSGFKTGQMAAAHNCIKYGIVFLVVTVLTLLVVLLSDWNWSLLVALLSGALLLVITVVLAVRQHRHYLEAFEDMTKEAAEQAGLLTDRVLLQKLRESQAETKVKVDSDDCEPKEIKVEVKRGRGRPRKNKEDK